MGKIKALVTDVTYTLTKKEEVQVPMPRGKMKTEEVYTYTGTNGAIVQFHAHPTKAWNWIIDNETNDLGKIVYGQVIEAFIRAGFDREDVPFNEAIKELKIGG